MFSHTELQSEPKSTIQIKRELLHQSRVTEQRQKMKKSIRFSNLSDLMFKKNQPDSKFILELSFDQAQHKLYHLLNSKEFILLACCIIQIQTNSNHPYHLNQIITPTFMNQFVHLSQDILYRPQIIAIYKSLSCSSKQFYTIIFNHPKVIKNLTKQIQSMKNSPSQELYLEVMQDLSAEYPKRFTEDINQLFCTVYEMLQNETISFLAGIKILKPLSTYVNQQLQFSSSTVNRLVTYFEQQYHPKQQQNQQKDLNILEDIFLILTKVIYYQKNASIQTNWRLIRVVLNANNILSSKVVYGYYNFFLLLAKSIDKIAKFQIEGLSYSEVNQLKYKLIDQYQVSYLDQAEHAHHQITSTLINQLLTQSPLLENYQYTSQYLYFLIILSKYCVRSVLLRYFSGANTFEFLVGCIDHSSPEICVLALEVLIQLLDDFNQNCEVLLIVQEQFNIREVLEQKLYRCHNSSIDKKINLILEKLDQYRCQI